MLLSWNDPKTCDTPMINWSNKSCTVAIMRAVQAELAKFQGQVAKSWEIENNSKLSSSFYRIIPELQTFIDELKVMPSLHKQSTEKSNFSPRCWVRERYSSEIRLFCLWRALVWGYLRSMRNLKIDPRCCENKCMSSESHFEGSSSFLVRRSLPPFLDPYTHYFSIKRYASFTRSR